MHSHPHPHPRTHKSRRAADPFPQLPQSNVDFYSQGDESRQGRRKHSTARKFTMGSMGCFSERWLFLRLDTVQESKREGAVSCRSLCEVHEKVLKLRAFRGSIGAKPILA